jgi:protein-arginine kinase activator protein McsA
MNAQLEMVYDYMARNGKYLKPKKVCKMCGRNDNEFTHLTALVCCECWNAYRKLSKYEKKELVRDKK